MPLPSKLGPLKGRYEAKRVSLTLPRLLLLLALTFAHPAAAEPLSVPGTLPTTVVPLHYAIELEPDLENDRAAGSAAIDVEVREPTSRLVLHAADLTMREARIDSLHQPAAIAMDAAAQTASLTFPQPLTPGPHKLHLTFDARINRFRQGLFAIEHRTAVATHRILAAQVEAGGARRIFPCWDEPAIRATIALTVTVPRAHAAIGNMPISYEEPVTPFLKQVSFARTPPMPASLFALVVGEFERLTLDFQGTTLNVLTAKGKAEHARLALASAARLLRYFDDYFGFKYPLPKLDLIALPGGMDDALEGWGAGAFSEAQLLFDRKTYPSSARRRVSSLLGRAMARQWLGSLVTSSAWQDLWLTEALAGTMGSKAAGHLFPRWPVGTDLHAAKEAAMQWDARRTSHPLQQSTPRESEPLNDFDEIALGKGAAVIRMLEGVIGADAFRTAIRSYIAQHAYGSATPADLWRAMEGASSHSIGDIAHSFTDQAGVPQVRVQTLCVDGRLSVLLQPDRYSVHDPGALPQSWLVPLTIGRVQTQDSQSFVLRGEKEILFGACDEAIKVNFGDAGYYRVAYDAASNSALTKSFALLSAVDRVNLLDDAWAMAEAGADASAYLFLIEQMGPGEDRGVWEQVIRTFGRLNRIARGRLEQARLQAYIRVKLRPVLNRLGWDSIAREDEESSMLRAQIVRALGELNDPEVVTEARRRFAAFLQDSSALDAELRDAVIHVVGLHADGHTYESLLVRARKSHDAAEQLRYYSAAASARDPARARASLDLILTTDIPDWLKPRLLDTIALAGEQPEMVWEFLKTHFAVLATRLGPRFRDSFVPNLMSNFADTEYAREFTAFSPAQASGAGRLASERAYAAIVLNAATRERVLPSVHAWIEANLSQN